VNANIQHAAWLSKTGLKDRLWTDKAIATFLCPPKYAGPVKACRREDVEMAENTAAFKDWMHDRCHSLGKRGVLEEGILSMRLTPPQRELLASIAAGEIIRHVEDKPEMFKSHRPSARIPGANQLLEPDSAVEENAYHTRRTLCAGVFLNAVIAPAHQNGSGERPF
jgi:hypothetical protein